jgi:hypothetical protein
VPDSTQSEAVRRTIVEVDWQIQRGAPVECDGGAVIRILVAAEGKNQSETEQGFNFETEDDLQKKRRVGQAGKTRDGELES